MTGANNPSLEAVQKHVQFLLDGKNYGMDIRSVQEILLADEIRTFKVPNSPDFLQGVLNLRGVLVPVVDLRIKMGGVPGKISAKSRIIICKIGRQDVVGALVDEFTGIVALEGTAGPMEIIDLSQVFSTTAPQWRAQAR